MNFDACYDLIKMIFVLEKHTQMIDTEKIKKEAYADCQNKDPSEFTQNIFKIIDDLPDDDSDPFLQYMINIGNKDFVPFQMNPFKLLLIQTDDGQKAEVAQKVITYLVDDPSQTYENKIKTEHVISYFKDDFVRITQKDNEFDRNIIEKAWIGGIAFIK